MYTCNSCVYPSIIIVIIEYSLLPKHYVLCHNMPTTNMWNVRDCTALEMESKIFLRVEILKIVHWVIPPQITPKKCKITRLRPRFW